MTVNVLPPDAGKTSDHTAAEAQALIKANSHVKLSGEVICEDCKGSFIIDVTSAVSGEPSDEGAVPDPLPALTTAEGKEVRYVPVSMTAAGSFSIVVPKHDGKMVLEVLEDADGNGRPSKGERFVAIDNEGKLSGKDNHTDLKVDFSKPMGKTPGNQAGPPPGGGPAGPPPDGNGN